MGFTWSTANPMTFKVLQCHTDPKLRSRVLHRGTVFPRDLNAVGYNSALQPKSDAYFPVVKPDGGIASKAVPSAPQGTVHPPDNVIAEGGYKRCSLSSQPSAVMRSGQSTVTTHTVVDEPSSTERLSSSATDDRGDVYEEGTTDYIFWSEMNEEEVQDQYNCTNECDGVPVEILTHYWHNESGELGIKTDSISGIVEDRFEAKTFKLDHTGFLALYILSGSIVKQRVRNRHTFCKAKEWRNWAEKFISNSKKSIARLVRVFGKDSLEGIFGSQVTLTMMRPLRFHRL